MANIADTHYRIFGSKKTIEKLNTIIKLGDTLRAVATKLGLNEEKRYMRGDVRYIELDMKNNCIDIDADTAWSEQHDFIDTLNECFADDEGFRIEWRCEEPGCDYYRSNVEGAIYGEYVSDIFCQTEYHETFEEMADYVEGELALALAFEEGDGHTEAFKTFEGMRQWLDKYDADHYGEDMCFIHKFEKDEKV